MFQRDHLLSEILDKDPLKGAFFYDLGIPFSRFEGLRLADVCSSQKRSIEAINAEMESWTELRHQPSIELLKEIPVSVLIAFLKNSHERFLWRRLPYMSSLVESLNPLNFDLNDSIKDLKLVFPIFINDFIQHIHIEEDGLFDYILEMNKICNDQSNPGKLIIRKYKPCLHELALEHLEDDDDMKGIRELTNDYFLPENSPLNLKLIYSELKEFEKELIRHAKIENDILFPMALRLVKTTEEKIQLVSGLN